MERRKGKIKSQWQIMSGIINAQNMIVVSALKVVLIKPGFLA
jgi:hypothetical protein